MALRERAEQLAWFVVLWIGGVAVTALAAFALRSVLAHVLP